MTNFADSESIDRAAIRRAAKPYVEQEIQEQRTQIAAELRRRKQAFERYSRQLRNTISGALRRGISSLSNIEGITIKRIR